MTLVRDCGAVPGSQAPPSGPGLPVVVSCGPLMAPAIPFLAHLREPVPPERLVATARERIAAGSPWVKILADAPGEDGNFIAATPTYAVELVAEMCSAVHDAGGRVAAHSTGQVATALVDAGVDSIEHGGWLDGEALARLGARGGAWTPTLSTALLHLQPLIDSGHPAGPFLQRHLDGIAQALAGATAAGVVVLAGTDEMEHGSVRDEVDLLRRFGLDDGAARASASTAAREFLLRA